jgi:mono/diheme cytochrome c family protein
MKKFIVIAFITCITACGAGSGENLNEQGLPITDNGGNEPGDGVTLEQLQQNIFGAICSACHIGANAPRGLRLDSADNSYAYLVNQAADEVPELMRVNPGNPDDSYIIRKLEGASDIVGGRMPLGGPYLSEDQIDQVRTWIANGAPYTGTNN